MSELPDEIVADITAEDIAAAKRAGAYQDCLNCPAAIAISRFVGRQAVVGEVPGRVDIGDAHYSIPSELSDFITEFDCGYTVAPCKHKLFRA